MASVDLETFLAKLYTDEKFLDEFQNDPEKAMSMYELSSEEKKSILEINPEELELASKSFRIKKEYVTSQIQRKLPFWKKWFHL